MVQLMTEKRKPGRPKGTTPPKVTVSIVMPEETREQIDKDRGTMKRAPFLLKKAGYGK